MSAFVSRRKSKDDRKCRSTLCWGSILGYYVWEKKKTPSAGNGDILFFFGSTKGKAARPRTKFI